MPRPAECAQFACCQVSRPFEAKPSRLPRAAIEPGDGSAARTARKPRLQRTLQGAVSASKREHFSTRAIGHPRPFLVEPVAYGSG